MRSGAILCCSLCCSLLMLATKIDSPLAEDASIRPATFAAYFESWISNTNDQLDTDFVNIPKSVTIVMLAFMKPDANYSGNLQLSGTGLEFQYSGATLRNSILELRKRNPDTAVFVSIGGETYTRWDKLNTAAIARFVEDFDLDGVDVDFEPPDPGCTQTEDSIQCRTDAVLQRSIGGLRANLPRHVKLSLTCGATGAYGEGEWKHAGPKGGPDYGTAVHFLRSRTAQDVNFLNIMAYDAGDGYDPLRALEAFQHYYSGPILLGFTPPPESWGNHSYSRKEIDELLGVSVARGAAGAMLFSLRKGTGAGVFTPYVNVIADIMRRSRS
jgi:chitinase